MSQGTRKLLLATDIPFWRADTGAALRINSLFGAIEALPSWSPTAFYTGRASRADRTAFEEAFPRAHLASPGPLTLSFAHTNRLLKGRGPSVHDALKKSYEAICRELNPAAVIIEYARLGFLWDGNDSDRPYMILDTIDLMYRREARLSTAGDNVGIRGGITRTEEATLLNRYDALLAIQEEEAAEFLDMCPNPVVVTVPHPVDVHNLSPLVEGNLKLAFVGGAADHNRLAIQWFLHEVWPGVRREVPSVELVVAGAVCDSVGNPPSGVSLLGRRGSVRSVYESAHVAINPIRAGSGLKIKNLEAMSFARSLVTTSIGSEGMRFGAGTAFLVADTPREWIHSLTSLDGDRAKLIELGQSGAAFVGEHFSRRRTYAGLMQLLEGL